MQIRKTTPAVKILFIALIAALFYLLKSLADLI